MSGPEPRPVPRHPRVWWSRLVYRWPFVVWLLAVGLCAFLYMHSGQTVSVSGAVEVQREEVAAMESARLLSVHALAGQRVAAGALLAEFDSALIDAEMNEIKAQLALDQVQTERQFSRALTDAEVRLHDMQFQQATEQNRLDALKAQFKSMDQVMDASADTARAMALYRAELDTLVRNAALYPDNLRLREADVTAAREQLEGARKANAPGAARELLASLEERKKSYRLHARDGGLVSRVLHRPGDVVMAGDPVVSLVVDGSQRAIGFVPEWQAHDISVGTESWLTRPMHSGNAVLARVTSLGPEILGLPTRVSPIQGQSLRGRTVELAIESPADFLPGESVTIHFSKPWWMEKYQELINRYTRKPAPHPPAAPPATT